MMLKKSWICLVIFFSLVSCSFSGLFAETARSSELLVYGGTAAGVMTAYSAAKQGLRVTLLEPGSHLGGMVTGGLSATDVGHYQIIGGYVRDFYLRAASHYGIHDLNLPTNWLSEPHIGEEIFQSMLQDAEVGVHFHQRIREQDGVQKEKGRIQAVTTEDGKQWSATIFADCSYEGDLMAQSGASYTWGRESVQEYNESLAGVRANTPAHQITWPLSAYDEQHRLYPEIDQGPLA
jgi:hypothetical protein